MASMMKAIDVLNDDFPEMRHRVLDLAAALDRIDRADGSESLRRDPRMAILEKAVGLLTDGKPDRVERAQLVFSLPYELDWQENL